MYCMYVNNGTMLSNKLYSQLTAQLSNCPYNKETRLLKLYLPISQRLLFNFYGQKSMYLLTQSLFGLVYDFIQTLSILKQDMQLLMVLSNINTPRNCFFNQNAGSFVKFITSSIRQGLFPSAAGNIFLVAAGGVWGKAKGRSASSFRQLQITKYITILSLVRSTDNVDDRNDGKCRVSNQRSLFLLKSRSVDIKYILVFLLYNSSRKYWIF